jgi:predicted nuclease of predicted toxin-antitoxin system
MNLRQFKLLTDENIDYELLHFLRNEGFDVFDIKEERLFSLPDSDILDYALKNERIIITQDSDFGTLVFRENFNFYGIIYLRPGHQNPIIHIQTFQDVLQTDIEFSTPFILVAENLGYSVKIRYRVLGEG